MIASVATACRAGSERQPQASPALPSLTQDPGGVTNSFWTKVSSQIPGELHTQ